jgi:putative membrane protein
MRITITLVLALILALIVTIFAVQNNKPENITFLAWSIEGSLALILMITFVLGIIIGLLVSTPAWIRRVRQSADFKKKFRGLEKELEEARLAAVKPAMDQPAQGSVVVTPDVDEAERELDLESDQELP